MLKMAFSINSFGFSDVGLVREQNEDVFCILEDKRLFVLADGMGGHNAGEIAAEMAVSHLAELLSSDVDIEKAFEQVNAAIYKKGQEVKKFSGMGTTLSCLVIRGCEALYAHIGDSRIYRLREEILEPLTSDHTLVNELIENGVMALEDASTFPYRHILTKAIGTNPVQVPTINQSKVEGGDFYLLCSDGLTNFVSEEQIQDILNSKGSLKEKTMRLIETVKKNNGSDNITIILLEIIP